MVKQQIIKDSERRNFLDFLHFIFQFSHKGKRTNRFLQPMSHIRVLFLLLYFMKFILNLWRNIRIPCVIFNEILAVNLLRYFPHKVNLRNKPRNIHSRIIAMKTNTRVLPFCIFYTVFCTLHLMFSKSIYQTNSRNKKEKTPKEPCYFGVCSILSFKIIKKWKT